MADERKLNGSPSINKDYYYYYYYYYYYKISYFLYVFQSTLGEKPSWSLYPRQEVGTARYAGIKAGNPAPNSYNPIEPNTFKRQSGVYTMQGRTKQKNYNSSSENPGPGAYEPKVAQKGSRGFSIGVKHSDYVTPLIIDVD